VGWLLPATGLSLTLSGAVSSYRWYGLVAPGALPAARYLAGLANGLNVVYLACAGFILLLTPTGTLPSRRWRWWARVAAAAAVVVLLASVVDPVPYHPQNPDIGNPVGVAALAGPLDMVIPLSDLVVLVAILRYRLYDIDRMISRTLAYALLTLLRGLGYAALVLGLGRLLPQDSGLVVAAATLAVAAAFQPGRRRIQQAVDPQFNRGRYDAARTIAAFSTRLQDQVDLSAENRMARQQCRATPVSAAVPNLRRLAD
jgi:hypothetical protein